MDIPQKSNDKPAIQKLSQLSLGPTITTHDRFRLAPTEQVKLAATAISLNVRLRSSDMPLHMQERALNYTRSLLDDSDSAPKSLPKFNPTHLARALKKVHVLYINLFLCMFLLGKLLFNTPSRPIFHKHNLIEVNDKRKFWNMYVRKSKPCCKLKSVSFYYI